ncbi:MAG: hypothetical protein J0651_05055 [Actinobacteria bacterium]|nr:hypothetical protein [Actinomycetota bacterium]
MESNLPDYGISFSAAIYNPRISLHLNRELWSVLNLAGVGVGVWSVFVLKRGK